MKTYNENGISEKLTLLLDGELQPGLEKELYEELAQNPELEHELQQQMTMREAVQSDTEVFNPPPHLTEGVFQKAGIAVPEAVTFSKAVTSGAAAGTNSNLLKKYALPGILTILALVTTVFLLEDNTTQNNEAVNSSKQDIPVISSQEINNRETDNNTVNNKINHNHNVTGKTINTENVQNSGVSGKTRSTNSNRQEAVSNHSNRNKQQISKSFEALDVSKEQNMPVYNIDNSRHYCIGTFNIYDPVVHNLGIFNSGIIARSAEYPGYNVIESGFREEFTFVYRGMLALSSPETDLQFSSGPLFQNQSVGIFLSTSEYLSFGAEVGQEPYGQVFLTAESDGVHYDQSPMVFWGTINGRYDFTFWTIESLNLHPMLQAGGGFSTLGPILRGTAGMVWQPRNSQFGMVFGIETSLVGYNNNNVMYSTDKYGLTIGINYKPF